MELKEAYDRLVRRHVVLLAGLVILPVAVVTIVMSTRATAFTGTTRLLAGPPNTSDIAAAAQAARVRATVTSRLFLTRAISASGVNRDPIEMAHRVSVRQLGDSGAVEISVSDSKADVAAALADSLTHQLTAFAVPMDSGQLARQIAALDKRLAVLGAQQDEDIRALPVPADVQAAAGLSFRSTLRSAEVSALTSERTRLLIGQQSAPGGPQILDQAAGHAVAVHPAVLRSALVAGLLGLVAAVGVAALIETVRPGLTGSRRIARELGCALVDELPEKPGRMEPGDVSPQLSVKLRLAARRAGVETVVLVGSATARRNVASLARHLDDLVTLEEFSLKPVGADAEVGTDALEGAMRRRLRVTAADPALAALNWDAEKLGLLAVVPTSVGRRDLEQLGDAVSSTGRPWLGVITYRASVSWKHRMRAVFGRGGKA